MIDTTMTLPDGRVLAYSDLGAPGGPLVLYFHGAPSSRLDLVPFDDDFTRRDVRVVCPDRPGYGRSSPHPGRRLHDWPDDMAALADHLGHERFAVTGLSSGGPYVVVCAALLTERVAAAAVVAGVTDVAWSGFFDEYDELWPGLVELMGCGDEVAATAWCDEHFGADGSRFAEYTPPLGRDDKNFFRDSALAEAFIGSMREALRQGMTGFAQDITIENQPWAFDPATVRAPVRVLHGESDGALPRGHSQHTADVLTDGVLEIVPGHGHLSIFGEFPAIATDLAATLRSPAA